MSYIPKYKEFSKPEGYQVTGYVNSQFIGNFCTSMKKKDLFEVRAFCIGDPNAQIIYFGTKKECLEFMKLLASRRENLPEPKGVVTIE